MHDADDVVDGRADHGVARVRLVQYVAGGVGERRVRGEERHLGPRHHHRRELAVRRAEDVGEHPPLLGPEVAVRADHVPQLLLGDLVAAAARVQPQQPHDDVGGARQQPDDRAAATATRSSAGATNSATASDRCSASRLGTSSPSTSDR